MNRYMRWTPEAAFGTYDSTSSAAAYVPMDTPNSFKQFVTRPSWTIRSGSGRNIPRARGSEIYALTGKLANRVYWENYLMALWVNPVNTAQTAPWTTNCRPTDLASATIDFGYSYYDLSWRVVRGLGFKPGASWKFSAGNDPANPFLTMDLDLIGSTPVPDNFNATSALTTTDVPVPTESQIPVNPVTFQEMVLSIGGTTYSKVDQVTISGQAMTKPYFDNGRFANRISHNGRTVTLTARFLLESANDPRTTYEAVSNIGACTVTFNKPGSGSHALVFSMRSKSMIDSVDENMVLDEDGYTTLTATAYLDSGTGDDFLISYS